MAEVLSATDAPAAAGAAATSRACCIELLDANPRPQTPTASAISASCGVTSDQSVTPINMQLTAVRDVL
ncbi:hypothetical protein D3C83_302160 [compost metagenome]